MAVASTQNFPQANTAIVNTDGTLTLPGLLFFNTLWLRSGGAVGNAASVSFNYPVTAGTPRQLLTSSGPGVPTTWTDALTKISQLNNDEGFVTQAQISGLQSQADVTNLVASYVFSVLASTTPLPDTTTGAVGTSNKIARADHQHPREASPTYSGTVTANKVVSGTATWTSGAGAPSAVETNGSLYSRTNGTTGARLYVSNGTTWNAVAGV